MKHILAVALTAVLLLSFSALIFAQQPQTAEKKQEPAKTTMPAKAKDTKMTEHYKNLSKDEIMALQNALIKAGNYKGQANGMLDDSTKAALKAYQMANKLKVTGMPDKETLSKLGVKTAAKKPATTMEKKAAPAKKPN